MKQNEKQELVEYRISKAKETIQEIEILIQNRLLNIPDKVYNDSELISKDLGKFYSEIFDKRLTGDYDDFIDYSEDDILELYGPAKELIHTIDNLL